MASVEDYIHVDDLAEGHICALQKATRIVGPGPIPNKGLNEERARARPKHLMSREESWCIWPPLFLPKHYIV